MRNAEAIFSVWAVIVGFWWIFTNPESAPQQSALAAQAMVMVIIPYCIMATLQRRREFEAKEKFQVKLKDTENEE